MTARDPDSGKDAAHARREKKLAEALRANLKRRKSAARSVAAAGPVGGRDTALEKAQDSRKDKD